MAGAGAGAAAVGASLPGAAAAAGLVSRGAMVAGGQRPRVPRAAAAAAGEGLPDAAQVTPSVLLGTRAVATAAALTATAEPKPCIASVVWSAP